MDRLLLMTQLMTLALPGCSDPAERRAAVLAQVDGEMRRGRYTQALDLLERATREAPRCVELWERSLEIRLDLEHCHAASNLMPAVANSDRVRLYHARYALLCQGDVDALLDAWKAGYGRHPDVLAGLAKYQSSEWATSLALTKALLRVREEKDELTLRAWLRAMPEPSWHLRSYMDVAGLLPLMHRVRETAARD